VKAQGKRQNFFSKGQELSLAKLAKDAKKILGYCLFLVLNQKKICLKVSFAFFAPLREALFRFCLLVPACPVMYLKSELEFSSASSSPG
jgi:hypothetical protein